MKQIVIVLAFFLIGVLVRGCIHRQEDKKTVSEILSIDNVDIKNTKRIHDFSLINENVTVTI